MCCRIARPPVQEVDGLAALVFDRRPVNQVRRRGQMNNPSPQYIQYLPSIFAAISRPCSTRVTIPADLYFRSAYFPPFAPGTRARASSSGSDP